MKLLEATSRSLKVWHHLIPVSLGSQPLEKLHDRLQNEDAALEKSLCAAVKKALGQGASYEVKLTEVGKLKEGQIEVTFHVDSLELDGEPPRDVVCTLS